MPNDTINGAIKKASGAGNDESYEEVVYEGYGPNGVAVIVEGTTNNRNRTAADVRHLFDKFGGNLGTSGCVSFMFDKKGVIIIEKNDSLSEDDLMMIAIDSGAEDFKVEEEYYEITTSPEKFSEVREKLETENIEMVEAEVQMVPQTTVKLEGDAVRKMQLLLDNLEDNDDVSEVFHNWEEDE